MRTRQACALSVPYHARMARPVADPRDGALGPASGPGALALPLSTAWAPCQYLSDPDTGVRFARPERTHRCTAVRPREPVAIDMQRATCLTGSHESCPAFVSARSRRETALAAADVRGPWNEPAAAPARTTPLILAGGGRSVGLDRAAAAGTERRRSGGAAYSGSRRSAGEAGPSAAPVVRSRRSVSRGGVPEGGARDASTARGRSARERARGPSPGGVIVAIIVVLGALAVVAARLPGIGRSEAAPSSPALAAATSIASPIESTLSSIAPTTSPTSVPTTTPTLAAETPTPPPTPVGAHTYRVKPGDTLSAIAARFGVSAQEIQQLNGISDPRLLQIGQVLKIP